MAGFVVEGGRKLEGEIFSMGAKNAVLPLLAASVLCPQALIENVPFLSDVKAALEILEYLGCQIKREGHKVLIKTDSIESKSLNRELSSKMRSSIIFLGALLGRFKEGRVSYPGGCELGSRPIDLHLLGFSKLGCEVKENENEVFCKARGKNLRGSKIRLPFPSVGATENIILASCLSEGDTIIENPAREPEIDDLISFLNTAGAQIKRENSLIIIRGVKKLHNVSYKVMPDRIEACTFLACSAVTGGEILIRDCVPKHFRSVTEIFENAGCRILEGKKEIYLKAPERLKAPGLIKTMPYPGFPTDCQSIIMGSLLRADGNSGIEENIFSDRFKSVPQFKKMGASIEVMGKRALIKGVRYLHGAYVTATDLRAGASLVVASLQAEGKSRIDSIYHIERGYESLPEKLKSLGARIEKIQE